MAKPPIDFNSGTWLQIAAWAATHDADSWTDLFKSWKAEQPDDTVADAATFRRYATRGLESLCGPGQRWKLGTDEDLAS